MRNVVLIMTASIDGYVTKPDGMSVGMISEPAELKRWKLDLISRAGLHAMGRKTYEQMKTVWPSSTDPYAAPMNDIPKIVFSKTLTTADWPESTIASGDLAGEINHLRAQDGGAIIAWGGATFAQSLARANLIDEYALITSPVAYGGGKPLFLNLTEALELELRAASTFASGHILCQYLPKGRG